MSNQQHPNATSPSRGLGKEVKRTLDRFVRAQLGSPNSVIGRIGDCNVKIRILQALQDALLKELSALVQDEKSLQHRVERALERGLLKESAHKERQAPAAGRSAKRGR